MHCLTKNIPKMWLSAHYSGGAIKPKTLWGRVIQQHTHLHYNIANGPVVDYNRVVVCIGANPGIELILNYTVGSLSEHCSYTLLAEKKPPGLALGSTTFNTYETIQQILG